MTIFLRLTCMTEYLCDLFDGILGGFYDNIGATKFLV